MSSIKVIQQGLENDLSIAKKMILEDENDYIIIQHLMQSLMIVNKQLLLELSWENNNNDKNK
jgi:hypothetical protein